MQPYYPGCPPGWRLRRASAGRKIIEHEKPTVPCLILAARLPRPWPSTEWWGVGRTGEKNVRTAPSPAHSRKNTTLKFIKHQKQPKEKNPDLQTQKIPETNQGKKPRKRKTVERGSGVKVN